jgi:hypothetical protein
VPVDETGLLFQVGEAVPPPAVEPQAQADAEALLKAAAEAQSSGRPFDADSLALGPARLQAALQTLQTLQARARPPVEPPEGLAAAVKRLQQLSLLAPFRLADADAPRYTVHRWTAAALAPRTPADALMEAHRRAARYWRWRVAALPQSREADLQDLLEARSHHHAAGDLAEAV